LGIDYKGHEMANVINGIFPGNLQPSTTVAGCIDIFENAWPHPDKTIQMIENEIENNSDVFWTKAGTVLEGSNQTYRTNKIINVTEGAMNENNPVLQNIHNQFAMLLYATSIPYAQKYHINETLYHEGYAMLKYYHNEQYKRHYDGGTGIGRAISAVCYLNNDYEGGEIEFTAHKIKIKPEPGMLILFPSNFAYAHIAHPIKSGIKYALVTWIKDRQL
jgi:hypothetical protein